MRILVTGAAGLVGSGVAARLQEEHEVIGLDLRAGPFVTIVADCLDVASWRSKANGLDAIIHIAALHAPHVGIHDEKEFRDNNVIATERLLEFGLSEGASHFVLTSTTSLYGDALEPGATTVWIDEQTEPLPRDIYDETKLEAEALVASAGTELCATSLRMSRCFPEPAEEMAWYRLYRGVDRRDVADAHALALSRNGPPATFVVSAATPFRREDCGELLHQADAVIERRCPGLLSRARARGWIPPRSIGRVYDCSAAMAGLGFAPRFGIDDCLSGDWDPAPSR